MLTSPLMGAHGTLLGKLLHLQQDLMDNMDAAEGSVVWTPSADSVGVRKLEQICIAVLLQHRDELGAIPVLPHEVYIRENNWSQSFVILLGLMSGHTPNPS